VAPRLRHLQSSNRPLSLVHRLSNFLALDDFKWVIFAKVGLLGHFNAVLVRFGMYLFEFLNFFLFQSFEILISLVDRCVIASQVFGFLIYRRFRLQFRLNFALIG
jgi:hypothetical protein